MMAVAGVMEEGFLVAAVAVWVVFLVVAVVKQRMGMVEGHENSQEREEKAVQREGTLLLLLLLLWGMAVLLVIE
jgi:hypothetical protein